MPDLDNASGELPKVSRPGAVFDLLAFLIWAESIHSIRSKITGFMKSDPGIELAMNVKYLESRLWLTKKQK